MRLRGTSASHPRPSASAADGEAPVRASAPAPSLASMDSAEAGRPAFHPPALPSSARPGVPVAKLRAGAPLLAFTAGRAFPPELAAGVAAVAGVPLSADGLRLVYAEALPGAHAVLDPPELKDGTLSYRVRWFDNAGEELARLERDLRRHGDGSLELHRFGTWVNPSQRGRGFSAKIFTAEASLLRALSPHPRTRATLIAGGSAETQRSPEQIVGAYAWGRFGFDFAENHGIHRFEGYDAVGRGGEDDGSKSDLELLRTRFAAWVDRRVEAGEIPKDPSRVEALKAAADGWSHPWDVASFDVPGLQLDVAIDGRATASSVGKAFLTSGEAVFWKGVFFVNGGQGSGGEAAWALNQAHVERTLARSATREAERSAGWERDLRSPDPKVRDAAIESIARGGTEAWQTPLLKARRRFPESREAVDAALRLLRGDGLLEADRARAEDPDLELRLRLGAVDRLRAATGTCPMELVRAFTADEDVGTRQAGLHLLFDAFASNPEALLGEAARVYAESHLVDEDEPEVRMQLAQQLAGAGEGGQRLLAQLLGDEPEVDVHHAALDALRRQPLQPAPALLHELEARLSR